MNVTKAYNVKLVSFTNSVVLIIVLLISFLTGASIFIPKGGLQNTGLSIFIGIIPLGIAWLMWQIFVTGRTRWTHQKRFLPLNFDGFDIELNPIQGICSNGDEVFVSTGLDHFTTSGSIIRIQNYKINSILDSSPYSDVHRKDTSFNGEYIGPTAFNIVDHCLYFYSQHGFFRGDPDKDLSSIEKRVKIARPRLYWSSGQRDAIGSPMNVLKISFFSDSKIVFLTELNGIGLITGDQVVFLK